MFSLLLGILIGGLGVYLLKRERPKKITYKPLPDLPPDTPEAPIKPKKRRVSADDNALRLDAEREKKGLGSPLT